MNPISGNKSIVAENLRATNPDIATRQWMGRHKRMCWRCQQEKPYKGGKLTKFNGSNRPFTRMDKFICSECVAKKESKE